MVAMIMAFFKVGLLSWLSYGGTEEIQAMFQSDQSVSQPRFELNTSLYR
jgi:hypothetical protein